MSMNLGECVYKCMKFGGFNVTVQLFDIADTVNIAGVTAAVTQTGGTDNFQPVAFANGVGRLEVKALADPRAYAITVKLSAEAAKKYAWVEESDGTKKILDRAIINQPLSLGYVPPVYFTLAPKLCRPRIGVDEAVPADGQSTKGLKLKLTSVGDAPVDFPFQDTDDQGVAYLNADHAGVPPGDYVVGGTDVGKLDAKPIDLKVSVKLDQVIPVFRFKIKSVPTKPKLQLSKGGKPVVNAQLTLVNDSASHPLTVTDKDGFAVPQPLSGTFLPGKYRVEGSKLGLNCLMPVPCTIDVPLGSTDTFPIVAVQAAMPKLRLLDDATGKPLAKIPVRFALTADKSVKHACNETSNSGMTSLSGILGMRPGNYTIELTGDRLAATLSSSATVDIAEGSTATIEAKATALKGRFIFELSRSDGAALAGRVKISVATKALPLVEVANGETVASADQVETAGGNSIVHFDRKELSLDPGDYILTITNVKVDLLDKHPSLTLGGNKNGVTAFSIEAGQVCKLTQVLSQYKKVQFVGYNVKPGYEAGFICVVCGAPAKSETACTAVGCAGRTSSKICPLCRLVHKEADTKCATCLTRCYPYCTACNKWSDTTSTCSRCNSDTTVINRCNSGAAEHNLAGGIGLCDGTTPAGKCTTKLVPICDTCHAIVGSIDPCTTHGDNVKYYCTTCSDVKQDSGGCSLHKTQALTTAQIYLGLKTNTEDLLARAMVMKKAIQTALTKVGAEQADTLKVFVGPEFYFRGIDGAYDAEMMPMLMEQLREETKKDVYKNWLFVYGTVIGYLRHEKVGGGQLSYGLRVTKATPGAKRVLHLASGTVVAAVDPKPAHPETQAARVSVLSRFNEETARMPLPQQWKLGGKSVLKATLLADNTKCGPHCPKLADAKVEEYEVEVDGTSALVANDTALLEEPLATEMFNYAMVQKGGPPTGGGLHELIVYKENISSIDFLRSVDGKFVGAGRQIFLHGQKITVLPTQGANDSLGQRKNPISGELNKLGIGGGSIFNIDGITFGLEVCLDHLMQKLKKFYQQPAADLKGAPVVQVQLIPSWGMGIKPGSLVGKVGTLVFNVDGPDGSAAATVSALGGAPASTLIPAIGTGTVVPKPSAANVVYKDDSKQPPETKTMVGLDPVYANLLVKNAHKVNGTASTLAKDYGWIDVFTATAIPEPETL